MRRQFASSRARVFLLDGDGAAVSGFGANLPRLSSDTPGNAERRRDPVGFLTAETLFGLHMGRTFSARGPFGPCPGVYDTRCPSRRSSKFTPSTFDMWKNMSLSVPVSINPKPFSVSRLIFPSAIRSHFLKKQPLRRCPTLSGRAAPPHNQISIAEIR